MKPFIAGLIAVLICYSINLAQTNKIDVDSINKIKLEQIIKERNGKVLLINFWATWCVPCREEFPDLVKLSAEYKNVEVIGVSIDFAEDLNSKVIPFLKNMKANFKNYLSSFKNDEELINFIEQKWNGALPATVIYDSKGKKAAFLEGKKNYKDFVKQLNLIDEK